MKIVLFQPQIPQNTGNIVRTCSVTGSSLVLVRPLGFSISNRWLKRAGLDHWENVDIEVVDDLIAFLSDYPRESLHFLSSKATKLYTQSTYNSDDILIFGSETTGLPQEIHERYHDRLLKIPMIEGKRCLNLATSAGIVVYEALRQCNYRSLV